MSAGRASRRLQGRRPGDPSHHPERAAQFLTLPRNGPSSARVPLSLKASGLPLQPPHPQEGPVCDGGPASSSRKTANPLLGWELAPVDPLHGASRRCGLVHSGRTPGAGLAVVVFALVSCRRCVRCE